MTEQINLANCIEAILLVSDKPMTLDKIATSISETDKPEKKNLKAAIEILEARYEDTAMVIQKLASGYVLQVKQIYADSVTRLFEEKPPRYSRALLETLVIIAYRQPITRGEIEAIRGVAVSSHITKTLLEREWVSVIGHRDVPGKPAILGTTNAFLDYFNLDNLNALPSLEDIKDLEQVAQTIEQRLLLESSVAELEFAEVT